MAEKGLAKGPEKSDLEALLKRIDALNRHIGQIEYRIDAVEQGSTPWMLTTGVLALAIIVASVGFATGSIRVNALGGGAASAPLALNIDGMYSLMLDKGMPANDVDAILLRGGVERTAVESARVRVTGTRAPPAAPTAAAAPTVAAPAPTQAASVSPTAKPASTGKKVKFQMFVMSFCPFGQQAEEGIINGWDRISPYIDLDVRFVIYGNYQGGGSDYCIKGGKLCSMHGVAEVNEDIRQACIMKYYGDDKFVEYVAKINKQCSVSNIESCWKGVAKGVGIDELKVSTCQSAEGETLMQADKDLGDSLGVQGSPTMYLDGAPYQGGRDDLSYIRAVCGKLPAPRPSLCENLPICGADSDCQQTGKVGKCLKPGQPDASCQFSDPVPVDVVILNKQSDPACDPTQVEAAVKRLFMGAKVRKVDVASDEGKALIERHGIAVVPKFIFGDTLEKTETWTTNVGIRSVFEKVGDTWMLSDDATGADCYVTEEARVKAEAEACAKVAKAEVPTMKLFIMSYCPFGIGAIQGMKPVVDLLGSKVKVEPHYVIYDNYGGGGEDYCMGGGKYCSMHGIQELHEDVRQACLYRLQPEKWWAYAMAVSSKCTAQTVDSCWEDQAKGVGVDVAAVKKCFDSDALTILAEEKALDEKYNARGSPTIILNEGAYEGKRDPESLKGALCCGFAGAKPAECATKLSAAASAPSGGCG